MKNLIIKFIRECFSNLEDQKNALTMAAYMKTTMPFYGIKTSERRLIIKQAIKKYPIQNQAEYLDIIKDLWARSHREEKYAAIDIARFYSQYIDRYSLSLFEQMIREGAWWDFVDDIAIHLVGTVLIKDLSIVWPILEKWSDDSNLWIRRTVIICQNKFKVKTDQKRLFNFCLQYASEKDFFIRKAIGWALREYAKMSPEAVYAFIEKNKQYFSNLSYREARKNIVK